MHSLQDLRRTIPEIEGKIRHVFVTRDLLVLAFTHRSYLNEHKGELAQHNERLEFLGDSVLGLVLADYLYHRLPGHPEGELSQLRAQLVDAAACAHYMQKLDLSQYILLGKGEQLGEGKAKTSILADVFEALVGACFLDGGLTVARALLTVHFDAEFETAIGNPLRNYKAELQDYSQKKWQKAPVYKIVQEAGPDHAKVFHVIVLVNEHETGLGIGPSKKEAEQRAALEALTKLGEGKL
jgi:ribonuclease-3